MTLGLWLWSGIVAIVMIAAALLKKKEDRILVAIASVALLLLGMVIAYYVNAGHPLDSLTPGEYAKHSEVRVAGDVLLVLASRNSNGTFGESLFYRIESWKLIDENGNPLSEIYDNFEMRRLTKKVTRKGSEGELRTEKSEFYLITRI